MGFGKSAWFGALATVGLVLAAGLAPAQNRDFPTHQANNGRTGVNGDPNLSGPGFNYLKWFWPQDPVLLNEIVADETDVANTLVPPYHDPALNHLGPYDTNPNALVTAVPPLNASNSPTGQWGFPLEDQEASGPFVPVRRAGPSALGPQDTNPRFPAYYFTRATASAVGNDPTIAANPADRRYVEWLYSPPAGGGGRNYQLWAWLPIGPTNLATPPLQDFIFPQRYFVYEIIYGSGQRFIDVVDTHLAGIGWVRLGNGGAATNKLFPWDGVNPIRVRLYNTVPRDANGNLTMPGDVTQYAVYADATKITPTVGFYSATPTAAGLGTVDIRVIGALNQTDVGQREGVTETITQGVVTSYRHFDGVPMWQWRVADASLSANVDNLAATRNGAFNSSVLSGRFQGPDYYDSLITGAIATATVTYAPDLEDGSYEIQAFISGNNNGQIFGDGVIYEVYEGATLVGQFPVNQATQAGWIRIGTRRFNHVRDNGPAAPLRVVVTNASALGSDIGKLAYADAIRFVGAGNLAVTSTPVHAVAAIRKNSGVVEDTRVVIVADESGRIHCLDHTGNPDGTTVEYWSYPSTPDPNDPGWSDPNQVAGEDGNGPIAKMPPSFDMSSALVQRIGGADYLFIAATNGRVYCINMEGRCDYDVNSLRPGTTTRRWTFPDDYPAPIKTSSLGAFRGSLAYADLPSGPTIFAPAREGRMYALDALGSAANKTTNTRWMFPALNQPTLGSLVSTPAYMTETGGLYFGAMAQNDDPGVFYALNGADGSLMWSFAGTPAVPALSWICAPAAVPQTVLDQQIPYAGVNVNTVYALNNNRFVYAFDAATGAVQWATDELGAVSDQALTYTALTVNTGIGPLDKPVILVPGNGANTHALFARTLDLNQFGFRHARTIPTRGDPTAFSVAHNWLFVADETGLLQARNNTPGQLVPGPSPLPEPIDADDTRGEIFRKAKIKLLTKEGYRRLRLPTNAPGHLDYFTATGPTYSFTRTPLAFEWGETVYIMVYDFPFDNTDTDGNIVRVPQINIQFSVEGRVTATRSADARLFTEPPLAPTYNSVPPPTSLPSPDGDERMNGYAILQFTFQGGGPNSLPPGNGEILLRISSSNITGQMAEIALNPAVSRQRFQMANPLGIAMIDPLTGTVLPGTSMGANNLTAAEENLVNGSPDLASTVGVFENRLLTSAAYGNHGQTKSAYIYVYDRSKMALIRPDGRGLEGVRVQRRDLNWRNGAAAIINPLDPTLYPNFEDLPLNFPNISIDYPDMARESVRAIKDPNGAVENPAQNNTSLLPPTGPGGVPITEANADGRTVTPTLFEFPIDVPRFQPANLSTVNNSVSVPLPAGYVGRFQVFVDSNQNGLLDTSGLTEAYRAFNIGIAVNPDYKMQVNTPSVDLGSLASGAGYQPARPGTTYDALNPAANTPQVFSPWPAFDGANWGPNAYLGMFKEFNVVNESNVNLLDVRLAKSSAIGGSYQPWAIPAGANDSLGWLDGSIDLWSDLDVWFAPRNPNNTSVNNVMFQKPRVGDRVGTELNTNPIRRENPNLATTGLILPPGNASPVFDVLNPALMGPIGNQQLIYQPGRPRVTVSIPPGFPTGKYSQQMRVISQVPGVSNEVWNQLDPTSVEIFTEPTFDLSFNVRESRGTNTFTKNTAPMVDDLVPAGAVPVNTYSNMQPAALRDPFGSLVVAFASNRPDFNPVPSTPAGATINDPWRIYIATLDNEADFGQNGITYPAIPGRDPALTNAPLRDLNHFLPNGARWFKQEIGPYPTTPLNTLFQAQAGENIIAGTAQFGSPAFPQRGMNDPYDPSIRYQGTFMAFVGTAQKQTASGRTNESRIFLSNVSTDAAGAVTVSAPEMVPHDPQVQKTKPSVLQISTGAVVFYGGITAGRSSIYAVGYNGRTFTDPVALPFGPGFENVSSPSATARLYRGVSTFDSAGQPVLTTNTSILDLTFSGKMFGRPNTETYLGRMITGRNGLPTNMASPFIFLPEQTRERLTASTELGVFRSRGVMWDRTANFVLEQTLNGVTTNLLRPGTGSYDRETNLAVYDSALGGKVYIDSSLGQVRFATARPNRNAQIFLTYTPRFIRLSSSPSAGYSQPTGLYDDRWISDITFWREAGGAAATASSQIRNDRYWFTYGRAASGAGQASRPYMQTVRFGVQLPFRIATAANGAPLGVSVAGNAGPYQIDPANGRIYFTSADENNLVTVNYQAVDESTNTSFNAQEANRRVSFVSERQEEQVPIEQSINESGVTPFIDPFNFLNQRRPPFVWMFWSSTRAGAPDVYFQTINPKLTPIVVGK